MQFLSSLLFVQLPSLVANLTSPSPSAIPLPPLPHTGAPQPNAMAAPQKFELPPLPYAYNALEPHISEQIMTLHHQKHHQAYVTNLNAAITAHTAALEKGNVRAQIALQQAIKFNGGGHINHSLFWPSLTPASSDAASSDAAPQLLAALVQKYGSVDAFLSELKKLLLGIQGSGWGWLVRDAAGALSLVTTKDQDPVVDGNEVVLGIDMWEHAYYLQYWNDKGSYVDNVLAVMNWEVAEARFTGTAEALKL